MREQELKLEKVKKSCNTAKKVVGVFKILMIVCAVLCFVGSGILFCMKNQVNEGVKQINEIEPDSFTIDKLEFNAGIMKYGFDPKAIEESGDYATPCAVMCILGGVVCVCCVIIFLLIQKIFITIEEEESPFSEKVLSTVKKLFIAIAVIMGLEIGLGIGLFLGLFFWCIYNIMDYGYALQKEIDETL